MSDDDVAPAVFYGCAYELCSATAVRQGGFCPRHDPALCARCRLPREALPHTHGSEGTVFSHEFEPSDAPVILPEGVVVDILHDIRSAPAHVGETLLLVDGALRSARQALDQVKTVPASRGLTAAISLLKQAKGILEIALEVEGDSG